MNESVDNDIIFAIVMALAAAALPADYVLRGATALYFDPPPLAAPGKVEDHVAKAFEVGDCGYRRGEMTQKCFYTETYDRQILVVRGLSAQELSSLAAIDDLVDTKLRFGFWGTPKKQVVSVSVAADGRELVAYPERRSKIMLLAKRRVLFGGLVLAVIAIAMVWRVGALLYRQARPNP